MLIRFFNRLIVRRTCLRLGVAGLICLYATISFAQTEDWRAQMIVLEEAGKKNPVYYDSALTVLKANYLPLLEEENRNAYKFFKNNSLERNIELKINDQKEYAIRKLDSILAWTDTVGLTRTHKQQFAWICLHSAYNHLEKDNPEDNAESTRQYKLGEESLKGAFIKLCKGQPIDECMINKQQYKIYKEFWYNLYKPQINLNIKAKHYLGAVRHLPSKELLNQLSVLDDEALFDVYMTKARVNLLTQDTIAAKELYDQLEARENPDIGDMTKVDYHLNYAFVLRSSKEYDLAEQNIQESLIAIENLDSEEKQRQKKGMAHLYSGHIKRDRGLLPKEGTVVMLEEQYAYFESAIAEYLQAQTYLQEGSRAEDSQLVYYALGEAYSLVNNHQAAEPYFWKTLQLNASGVNEEKGELPLLSKIQPGIFSILSLEGLSDSWFEAYKQNKDVGLLSKAAQAHQLIQGIEKELRNSYRVEEANLLLGNRRRYFEKSFKVAQALWKANRDLQSIELALSIIGRSRAIELQENIIKSELNIQFPIPKDLLGDIHLARWFWQTLQDEIKVLRADPSTSQSLLAEKQKAAEYYQRLFLDLSAKVEAEYPAYYQSKFPSPTPPLSEIQATLKNREALISYFWGTDSLYILTISKNTYDLRSQALASSFKESLAFMDGFVQESAPSDSMVLEYREIGHELYRVLLGHIDPQKVNSLILIPDNQLHLLPYEILLTKPDSTTTSAHFGKFPYLWKQYQTRYAYYPGLITQESHYIEGDPEYFYSGFAPSYREDIGNRGLATRRNPEELKYNSVEVENAYQIFKSMQLAVQKFDSLSAQEFLFKQYAPESKILHVAMHNLEANSDFAQLVFDINENTRSVENDGSLFLYEIYPLKLKAELVLLNACETGRGKLKLGEGLLSMGRAFQMAGCKSAVTSLWDVNDLSSSKMTKLFFENLAEGFGKAEALKRTREQYLASAPNQEKAPYYWAQFVLHGDNEPVFKSYEANVNGFLLALLSLIVISILANWGISKRS